MIRTALRSFLLCLLLPLSASTQGQVMQTHNLASAVKQARTLMAGATASDVPHHVHYDVRFLDRSGHKANATYDVYRDPGRFIRVDIASSGYTSESIEDILGKHSWRHATGEIPLKLFDLGGILLGPEPALYGLDRSRRGAVPVHQQMVDQALYLCGGDQAAIRVCFDPLIRAFAFAQVFNETFVYGDWKRIGTHAIPGKIQIFDDTKLLVDASGTVEPVEKFPPRFFQAGPKPSTVDTESRPVVHMDPVPPSPFYGNVQIQIEIDPEGKVAQSKVLDLDDKRIKRPALKFIRSLRFASAGQNADASAASAAAISPTLFYLRYFPQD